MDYSIIALFLGQVFVWERWSIGTLLIFRDRHRCWNDGSMDKWSKIAQASTYQFFYSSSFPPPFLHGPSVKIFTSLHVGATDHWINGSKLHNPPHINFPLTQLIIHQGSPTSITVIKSLQPSHTTCWSDGSLEHWIKIGPASTYRDISEKVNREFNYFSFFKACFKH